MQKVTINLKNGNIEMWSIDELTRWMCLIEAYDIIHQKAEQLGVGIGNMLNSKAIDEYIHGCPEKNYNGRFPSMRHDVGVELELGLL